MSTAILLNVTNAKINTVNTAIADTIVRVYMMSTNFYIEDCIKCMSDFLATGVLNFGDYNIRY